MAVTREQIDEAVALGRAQIMIDILVGQVPEDVASFSELHDYVDAN